MSEIVEVVYWRRFWPLIAEFDAIDEAIAFIRGGSDDGNMASEGIFVNGEPKIHSGYVDRNPPTEEQAKTMREAYRHAKAETTPWGQGVR